MGSLSKYDYILAGIAITIVLMLTGIIVINVPMTLAFGSVAALMTGFAMFVVPPTTPTNPNL